MDLQPDPETPVSSHSGPESFEGTSQPMPGPTPMRDSGSRWDKVISSNLLRDDLLPDNPNPRPDRRWQVGLLLARGEPIPKLWLDPVTLRLARLAGALMDDQTSDTLIDLYAMDPQMMSTIELKAFAPEKIWEIEARILSGQSPTDIAQAVEIRTGVIWAYEQAFFDVQDRIRHRAYIQNHVIRRYQPDGHPLEKMLKDFAYLRGPNELNALLETIRIDHQSDPTSDPTGLETYRQLLVRASVYLHHTPTSEFDPAKWRDLLTLIRENRPARQQRLPFSDDPASINAAFEALDVHDWLMIPL